MRGDPPKRPLFALLVLPAMVVLELLGALLTGPSGTPAGKDPAGGPAGPLEPNSTAARPMAARAPAPVGSPVALAAPEAPERKVLYVAEEYLPWSLNPLNISTIVERRTLELIHDAPFQRGDDAAPESSLIELGPDRQPILRVSQDRKVVDGRLKEARFHNGLPVTVADLRASFQAYESASRRRLGTDYYHDIIESVAPLNSDPRREFRIRLRRPLPTPQEALSLKLLPSLAFATPAAPFTWADDRGFSRRPVGAGPFRVREHPEGNLSWTLEAFPDYHRGAPKLDAIQIVAFPSVQEQLNALRAGQVHVIVSLKKDDQTRARSYGAWTLPYFIRNWWYIGFNCRAGALQSKEVRRALGLIVNRGELARQLAREVVEAGGTGSGSSSPLPASGEREAMALQDPSVTLITGPFVPESVYYDRTVPQPRVDPAAAAGLLRRQPGFTYQARSGTWHHRGRPWTLQLAVRRDLPGWEDLTTLLKQQLADAGINLRVSALDHAAWDERVEEAGRQGKLPFDLLLGRWNMDRSDEIDSIFRTGGIHNVTGFSSPALDRLFEAFDRETDYDKRVTLMRRAHRLIAETHPALFLWEANQVAAFSRRVTGYRIHAFSFYVNPHRWDLKPEAHR